MNKEYFAIRETCPGCKSEQSVKLVDFDYTSPPISDYLTHFYSPLGPGVDFKYLAGSRYRVDECQACGLIYQREIPNDELMEMLYEHWLDADILRPIEQGERTVTFYMGCTAEIARVLNYFGKPPATVKFLDFGMGWGNWCLIAKGFGCDVYGTELSDTRLRNAAPLGINSVRWEELPNYQFDFINAEQVFEHLAQPLDTLIHLKRALRPGGILRLGVPPGLEIKRRLAVGDWLAPESSPNSLNDIAPLQHINCFNFDAMVTMGRLAGLEEIEIPSELLQPATLVGKLKSLLRPYHHALFPRQHQANRRRGTTLCFRRSDDNRETGVQSNN